MLKGPVNFLVRNKNILVLDFGVFMGDAISGVGFWPFWLRVPALALGSNR